jgi:hypothetical protein
LGNECRKLLQFNEGMWDEKSIMLNIMPIRSNGITHMPWLILR